MGVCVEFARETGVSYICLRGPSQCQELGWKEKEGGRIFRDSFLEDSRAQKAICQAKTGAGRMSCLWARESSPCKALEGRQDSMSVWWDQVELRKDGGKI